MQSVILHEGFALVRSCSDLDRRVFESVPTGIDLLDARTGGLPRGAITEIFGPRSSGRTSTMIAILAEATDPSASGEVCALVDGNNAFDPKSAAEAGVELSRLLWVRCRTLDQVLKSTDLLLQGGGFGRVVMDLTDLPLPQIRSIPLASWFRFQRTIEKTPTVLLVMTPESIVKSAAALALRMEMRGAEWSTILNGLNLNIEVVRCRAGREAQARQRAASLNDRPYNSHVRVHLHSECVR